MLTGSSRSSVPIHEVSVHVNGKRPDAVGQASPGQRRCKAGRTGHDEQVSGTRGIRVALVSTACLIVTLGLVAAGPPAPSGALGAGRNWTVYHHDPAGLGVAGPIDLSRARRVWASPALDGQLYGEPLVIGSTVIVATENDTVYALSAKTGRVRWSTHVGTPVSSSSLPCGDIAPTLGITSTPVIDPARNEVFVVADERGSEERRVGKEWRSRWSRYR